MLITSVNLGSFNTSKELLAEYTRSKKVDIVCVSESFEFNDNIHMNGWKLISKAKTPKVDDINPHGGVAILARVSVKIRKVCDIHCPDIEVVCCETFIDNQKLLLVCTYILTDQDMNTLCRWIPTIDTAKYPNIMICGDFNAHHTLWDPTYRMKRGKTHDTRGKILFNCISNNDFSLRNDKKPTCKQGNYIINLVLTRGLN